MKTVFLSLVLILSATAFAGGGKAQLTYCSETYPNSLSPVYAMSMTALDVDHHIYDPLVEVDRKTNAAAPGLAESWKISKDGKTYTFNLRKNVQFHKTANFTPTRPMNADDVIYSLNRMRKTDHPYNKVGGGTYNGFVGFNLQTLIKDVRKKDDLTVEIELTEPVSPFVYYLTSLASLTVFSKEYAEQLIKEKKMDNLDLEPVGTGPFYVTSQMKDVQIRMKAFDKYFRGPAQITDLVFLVTPDSSVRQQKLLKGECDFIYQPEMSNLKAIAQSESAKIIQGAGANYSVLQINTDHKPYDNPLVRKAIAHALNREAYISSIYLNRAKLLKVPLPSTNWAYPKQLPEIKYDPVLAKKLLTEAGFPNGFETNLWALPVSRAYNPNGKKLAELMQYDLAKIGIKAKIVTYDWSTYLDKSVKGEYDLLQIGTNELPDPDAWTSYATCAARTWDSNRWCNKDFDAAVNKARRISDRKERAKLYNKAFDIFLKDMPWVPVASGDVVQAASKRVSNYQISTDGSVYFYGVSVQ